MPAKINTRLGRQVYRAQQYSRRQSNARRRGAKRFIAAVVALLLIPFRLIVGILDGILSVVKKS